MYWPIASSRLPVLLTGFGTLNILKRPFFLQGMPARNGASSALMVHHGFTGVKDPFRGSPNWLLSSIFVGLDSDLDLNKLIHHLGQDFQMPLVAYKRYPVKGAPPNPASKAFYSLSKKLTGILLLKSISKCLEM